MRQNYKKKDLVNKEVKPKYGVDLKNNDDNDKFECIVLCKISFIDAAIRVLRALLLLLCYCYGFY